MFKFVVTALFFLGGLNLQAQQEGSVAIASAIRMEGDTTTQDLVNCVRGLVQTGVLAKDARGDCKEVLKDRNKTSAKIANEAADATKASRPVVVVGSPYGRYYSGGRATTRSRSYRRPPNRYKR